MSKQFAFATISSSVIQEIHKRIKLHISINSNDIRFLDIIYIIFGNEVRGILLADSVIKNILDNQLIIEIYEMFVLYKACKNFGILKINGDSVQQIQRSSDAK